MRKREMWEHSSVLVLALCLAAPTQAQQRAGSAYEGDSARSESETDIIVTARKREERLQDIPAVVSALTGETADDLGGANTARDLVALVPGVTFIESAQGPTAEPNIRGAGQARLPNSDSAVGLYRNGAYIAGGNLGGRTFQRFDLFDVERTEVLRGPQGALYGRNAVGGAINVISRRPEFDFGGEIELIGGSQKTYGATAILNAPLNDRIALRAGLDFRQQDGGFYRTSAGAIVDQEDYIGGRISVRVQPSDALDIVFLADYSDESGFGGTAVPTADADGSDFIINEGTPQTRAAEQFNLSLNADWQLGDVTLVSVTNYRNRKGQLTLDNDGGKILNEINFFDDDAETFFQELRAQGDSADLRWLVGADLFYLRDVYFNQRSGFAIIPATMTMAAINPNFNQTTDIRQTSYSAFASLEYDVTDRFSVEVEGRYSIDEKSLSIVALRADGTPRYTDFPPNSPASNPSDTFKNFNYGVTASYRVTPDFLTFARVATAYRAGGFNADLGNPCGPGEVAGVSCNIDNVPPSYGEEHSINYEVGVKTSWLDRRLLLNANIYRIDYDDLLANLNNGIMPMADPLNGALFLDNAGDARMWGFEIEMAVRPPLPPEAGNLQLALNVGKQEGEFRNVPARVTGVLNGNELARLRPWTIGGNFIYRLPLSQSLGFLLSANYLHEDGGFQNATNSFVLGTVDRLNARVALEGDGWQLGLLVRNAANSRFITNQGGTAVNGLGTEFRRNDPRSYEVTLRYRW